VKDSEKELVFKKGIFFLLFLFCASYAFGQDLSEYFGVNSGVAYIYVTDYTENGGKEVIEEVHVISEEDINKTVVMHTTQSSLFPAGRSTIDIYEVYADKVIWVNSLNILGQRKKQNEIVMKKPGEKWRVNTNTDGEYYEYTSSLYRNDNNVEFLLIQKNIYVRNKLFVQEKKYYLKKIGLAITKHIDSEGKEMPSRVFQTVIESVLYKTLSEEYKFSDPRADNAEKITFDALNFLVKAKRFPKKYYRVECFCGASMPGIVYIRQYQKSGDSFPMKIDKKVNFYPNDPIEILIEIIQIDSDSGFELHAVEIIGRNSLFSK